MKQLFLIGVMIMLCVGLSSAQEKMLSAVAVISGTEADSPIIGIVNLTESKEGLVVQADLQNIPNPGPHGFHIHEIGSCDNMGKAAGGHFNPENVMHGMMIKDGPQHAHAGDMGNIVVNADGVATLKVVLPDVGLENGKYHVKGLAIILHENVDDFGQPTGNAGGRIACGIIEVKK